MCLIIHWLFGGIGSLVLIGGDPGVGKSTLLLQVAKLNETSVSYCLCDLFMLC